MWREGNPFALLMGMQAGAATVESSMEISQKIKNGSVFLTSNPTSGNISDKKFLRVVFVILLPYVFL